MNRAILIFVPIAVAASIGLAFLVSSLPARTNSNTDEQDAPFTPPKPPIVNVSSSLQEYQFVKRINTILVKPEEGKFAEGIFGISLDNKGNIFVSDSSNARIQKFEKDGSFVTAW